MARKYAAPTFKYSTLDVFAAAVRAYSVNKGYLKEAKATYADDDVEMKNPTIVPRNLDLMRQYLSDKIVFTEAEYAEARTIIDYYQGKLVELMTGKLNSYSMAACSAANKEEITEPVELGLIASLPKAYRSSIQFDNMLEAKERANQVSRHFGNKGDVYEGTVKVISSVYSQKWFRYFHTVQDQETQNVVNFSTSEKLDMGKVINIRGRVKDHVDGNVTRLNYVKING